MAYSNLPWCALPLRSGQDASWYPCPVQDGLPVSAEQQRLQDELTYDKIRSALLHKVLDLGLQSKNNKVGIVFYGTVRSILSCLTFELLLP
jgi:hypothetical protein